MRALILSLVLAIAAAGAHAAPPAIPDAFSLGNPKAKIRVEAYASLSCTHCAHFNNEIFPAFKKKYIDTGKVHYVFRDFLAGPPDLAAAGALLARCAGKDRYFTVGDAIFHAQTEIFSTGDIRGPLLRIAETAGMNEDQFNKCVGDEKALAAFNARVEKYSKEAKIEGTPTFFFGTDRYDKGELSMAEIDVAYAKALAASKKK